MNAKSTPATERHFIYAHRGLLYSIPVTCVLEIVKSSGPLPCHADLPGCVGNMAHRGRLLPVFDSARLGTSRLDADIPPAAAPGNVIVIEHGRARFGLSMEKFVAVVALPPAPGGARPTP